MDRERKREREGTGKQKKTKHSELKIHIESPKTRVMGQGEVVRGIQKKSGESEKDNEERNKHIWRLKGVHVFDQ